MTPGFTTLQLRLLWYLMMKERYFCQLFVLVARKNCATEAILMSTSNICFSLYMDMLPTHELHLRWYRVFNDEGKIIFVRFYNFCQVLCFVIRITSMRRPYERPICIFCA